MTEKKYHFTYEEQKRPYSMAAQSAFKNGLSAFKNGLCVVNNLETVIDAITNRPKDVAISRNQKPNILFLKFRKLLIHKEIAQQFGAFHTQRTEAVAVTPMAQCQGKTQFVEIQLSHIG